MTERAPAPRPASPTATRAGRFSAAFDWPPPAISADRLGAAPQEARTPPPVATRFGWPLGAAPIPQWQPPSGPLPAAPRRYRCVNFAMASGPGLAADAWPWTQVPPRQRETPPSANRQARSEEHTSELQSPR